MNDLRWNDSFYNSNQVWIHMNIIESRRIVRFFVLTDSQINSL